MLSSTSGGDSSVNGFLPPQNEMSGDRLAESTPVGLSLIWVVGCSGSTISAVDGVAEQAGQSGSEREAPVQLIGAPDPRLAGVLARRYVGFRQPGIGTECWLEPPQPSVTLIVTLDGRLRAGGNGLPGAWWAA